MNDHASASPIVLTKDANDNNGSSPQANILITINLLSKAHQPILEIIQPTKSAETTESHETVENNNSHNSQHYLFYNVGNGRNTQEKQWQVEARVPAGKWYYRIKFTSQHHNTHDASTYEHYDSILPKKGNLSSQCNKLWIQDEQVFDYQPAPTLSSSTVIKVPILPSTVENIQARAIYIYLPRGYTEQPERYYPVLYMHDGQNCFETYVQDSFAGSWQADHVADMLIDIGQMRETIIVGVGNGGPNRLAEYLPPYASYKHAVIPSLENPERTPNTIQGRANATAAYYQKDVFNYLNSYYRVLEGGNNTATCGSSMGGLFSAYLAWEYPEFACHHALMSSAFWVTKDDTETIQAIERMQQPPNLPVRLWLDSGTGHNSPRGGSDDNKHVTIQARDTLLNAGFEFGENFQYYLDEGAQHHEADWAKRLDKVFTFLFPLK